MTGAVGRNRTGDLLITNQLLYQLSYFGVVTRKNLIKYGGEGGIRTHVGR